MCSISCLCELSYFKADHRFLRASIVEFKGVQGEKKLLMIMMVNIWIIIMRKIKEKVFVKKQTNKFCFLTNTFSLLYFIVKRLTEQLALHNYVASVNNRMELVVS